MCRCWQQPPNHLSKDRVKAYSPTNIVLDITASSSEVERVRYYKGRAVAFLDEVVPKINGHSKSSWMAITMSVSGDQKCSLRGRFCFASGKHISSWLNYLTTSEVSPVSLRLNHWSVDPFTLDNCALTVWAKGGTRLQVSNCRWCRV